MLHTDKELKLYYSIAEVADMFGVNPLYFGFGKKNFHRFLLGLVEEEYVNIARRT